MAGGVRRGTDLLKACALGAKAVFAGKAPLYGVCAAGGPGAKRALDILEKEADDALGLLGAVSPGELDRSFLASKSAGEPIEGLRDRRQVRASAAARRAG